MAKDRKARSDNQITVIALGNMLAAIVDAMRGADVPNDVVRQFLDRLDHLNALTLSGIPGAIMSDVIEIVRGSVPSND
jgi:hypothetical protein